MPSGAVPPTALGLADAIATAIPHHTLLDWLNEGVMPAIGDHLPRCPRCGRRVPCSVGQQAGQEGDWIPLAPGQLVAGCLVDGPRAAKALPFVADEIVAAITVIAGGAQRQGWKATTRFLQHASDTAGDVGHRVERCGQALEAVRVYGLFAVVAMRASRDRHPEVLDAAITAQRDLDVLVASSGPFWPTGASPRVGRW